jgi:dTDP-4-dehydrorhamnose reductase
MKIVLFGGNGILGSELRKIDHSIHSPSSSEVNICNLEGIREYIKNLGKVDLIINAAAETDNRKVEKMPIVGIQTNIIGAANVAIICQELGIRLVYFNRLCL